MNWMTIRSVGFSYQEVYLDAQSIMVGSVTRRKGIDAVHRVLLQRSAQSRNHPRVIRDRARLG